MNGQGVTRFLVRVRRSAEGLAGVVILVGAVATVPLLLVNDHPVLALLVFLSSFIGIRLVSRARAAAMAEEETAARKPRFVSPSTVAWALLLGWMLGSAFQMLSNGEAPDATWYAFLGLIVFALALDIRHAKRSRTSSSSS